MFEIKGKTAIVTGGASGIGLSTVEALLAKGANVVMSDINEHNLHIESTRLTLEYPMMITTKVTNVSNPDEVKELVNFAVDKFGSVDIMVANAGIAMFGNCLDETALNDYHKVIDVNQHGVFYCNKFAIEQMTKQGNGGAIVNISSIEGLIGDPQLYHYNATKGAVRLLTKSLALAHAKDNIRLNTVHPGYITTGMINPDSLGQEHYEGLKALHPLSEGLGRIGLPEEISSAVIFAIENSFMTGSEIVVDGGYTAQ